VVPAVPAPASAPEAPSAHLPEAAREDVPSLAAASDAAEAARQMYRSALEEGRKLTGADLGNHFRRSDRWGRLRIAECRV